MGLVEDVSQGPGVTGFEHFLPWYLLDMHQTLLDVGIMMVQQVVGYLQQP
jgi:hypothetical protein